MWYLLACTHFDTSRYYAFHFVCISVDRRESVVTHITEMILPFVTCSPNFIIHFHLRVDAHVNIPVQTPMFHNRPTFPPSRKSTATLRCNIFLKAHHCKSAPFWRNSYHSFLIFFLSAGDPIYQSESWLYIACLLHDVRNVEVTVDPTRYLRDDPGSVV